MLANFHGTDPWTWTKQTLSNDQFWKSSKKILEGFPKKKVMNQQKGMFMLQSVSVCCVFVCLSVCVFSCPTNFPHSHSCAQQAKTPKAANSASKAWR